MTDDTGKGHVDINNLESEGPYQIKIASFNPIGYGPESEGVIAKMSKSLFHQL